MKKTKFISLATLAIASAWSVQASAMSPSDFRLVTGTTVKYEDRSGTLTSVYSAFNGGAVPATTTAGIKDTGSGYGGFSGFQFTLGSFLVGFEGHVESARIERPTNFTSTDSAGATPAATNVAYKRNTQWGLSALVGFKADKYFTPYFRVGAQRSTDKLAVSNIFPTANDFVVSKVTITNPFAGVGVEVPLFSDKVSVRLEYDHFFDDKHTSTDALGVATGTHAIGVTTKAIKAHFKINLPVSV